MRLQTNAFRQTIEVHVVTMLFLMVTAILHCITDEAVFKLRGHAHTAMYMDAVFNFRVLTRNAMPAGIITNYPSGSVQPYLEHHGQHFEHPTHLYEESGPHHQLSFCFSPGNISESMTKTVRGTSGHNMCINTDEL
jgi:hypothetical protein